MSIDKTHALKRLFSFRNSSTGFPDSATIPAFKTATENVGDAKTLEALTRRQSCASPATKSASLAVLMRCVIMTHVRPWRRRPIASVTSSSLRTSSADVGSSRNSSGASRKNARAITKRCRCPTLRLLKVELIFVSRPFFNLATMSEAPLSTIAFCICCY